MPSYTIASYNIEKHHMVTFFILIPTVTMTPESFMIQYRAVRSAEFKLSNLISLKGYVLAAQVDQALIIMIHQY